MRQKEMRSDDGMTPEKRFRAVTYHARCAKKTALLDTSHRVNSCSFAGFMFFHVLPGCQGKKSDSKDSKDAKDLRANDQ